MKRLALLALLPSMALATDWVRLEEHPETGPSTKFAAYLDAKLIATITQGGDDKTWFSVGLLDGSVYAKGGEISFQVDDNEAYYLIGEQWVESNDYIHQRDTIAFSVWDGHGDCKFLNELASGEEMNFRYETVTGVYLNQWINLTGVGAAMRDAIAPECLK